jgi:hypothetical protein
MSDTRKVKTSRIKKLNARGKIAYVVSRVKIIDDEEIKQRVLNDIAREFATKLLEFHKVKIKRSPGVLEYDASLEVIVPEAADEENG